MQEGLHRVAKDPKEIALQLGFGNAYRLCNGFNIKRSVKFFSYSFHHGGHAMICQMLPMRSRQQARCCSNPDDLAIGLPDRILRQQDPLVRCASPANEFEAIPDGTAAVQNLAIQRLILRGRGRQENIGSGFSDDLRRALHAAKTRHGRVGGDVSKVEILYEKGIFAEPIEKAFNDI